MSTSDFRCICDCHLDQVYGFFAYVVGSRADAEDLTQQTFERAMRAWDRYDETRASTATWLLAIARNLLIDHLRARRAVGTLEEGGLETMAAPPDRPSLGPDPDVALALAQLAPRERELIGLRFGGDLTSRQIARLTGLTAANVEQILSRSLRRMRATLDRQPVGAAT